MSVLIKGMKMPKDGEHYLIQINSDGTIYDAVGRRIAGIVVELPLHGRLIDANVFDVIAYQGIPDGRKNTFDDGVEWLASKIDTTPTIIEAEGVE